MKYLCKNNQKHQGFVNRKFKETFTDIKKIWFSPITDMPALSPQKVVLFT